MRDTLDTDFFTLPRPRAFGHRGAAGTHPENTMVSFQAAVDLGVDYLELDIHMTRDGEVVVTHDESLERTCGRPGLIKEMDYSDVALADAGYTFSADGTEFPFRGRGVRIPRLSEVLSSFPKTRFVIEAKQIEPSLVAAMLRVIEVAGMRRMVLIASEHQKPLDEVRAFAPGIPSNLSYEEGSAFFKAVAARDDSYKPPCDALQIPPTYGSWRLATPTTVEMAHRWGIEVHVWTVNDESEMAAMLDIGVDGLISDFPGRALRVISERRAR